MSAAGAKRITVYLEVAPKRSFAAAVDWPGWCRSGKTADEALERLLAYARRYAAVVPGGIRFSAPGGVEGFDVTERLRGGGGTEFGVPGGIPKADQRELDRRTLARQVALLQASWQAFDAAAEAATGKRLSTGPRGGGRNRPKMIDHVLEAERAYVAQLGARPPPAAGHSIADQAAGVRDLALAALDARATGEPIPNPRATRKPWPPRYYVRRSAWHALDHAWELEDRASG